MIRNKREATLSKRKKGVAKSCISRARKKNIKNEVKINKIREYYSKQHKINIIVSSNVNLVYFDDEYFIDIEKYSI